MKISIIVPVYNCEKYIRQCIESIIEQTFRDFELIIINDGSTDNTVHILKEYKRYNYIKIINQNNKGVSHARNNGIVNALGEYICFIDGDDYIDKNFLSTYINEIIDNKYDWILSGIYDFNKNAIIKEIKYEEKEWNMNNYKDCTNFYSLELLTAPFPKLFKKDIIDKHNLRFNTNLSLAEDREFNYKYAQYTNTIKTIPYKGYYYRVSNPNSLSKKSYPHKLKYDCLHWEIIKTTFEKKGFNNNFIQKRFVNELFHCINDNIILLANSFMFNEAIRYWNENSKYIDRTFLIKNQKFIKAPKWLIISILFTPKLIFIIEKFKKWKSNIQKYL